MKLKRLLGGLVLLLLVLGMPTICYAGATGTGVETPEAKTVTQFITYDKTETHRVVSGYAEYAIGPNFLDNDWDRGDLSGLTQAEKDYLRSLTGLSARVTYYIDMTGQTVSTSPFTDSISYTTEEFVNVGIGDMGEDIFVRTRIITIEGVRYQIVADVYDYSPVVLDLDDNGKIDVAYNYWLPHAPKFYREYARFFDITGDGMEDFTEWMARNARDGLLVMPENGKVENALQLFGTAGGYKDGYEKLSILCDKDRNGWVEQDELAGLAIWIDANNNGICESNELHNLADFNIRRIATKHTNFTSKYSTSHGENRMTWDWWPAVLSMRKFKIQ